MSTARESGKFTRGTASKLYGIANFWGQGIYGRVGYGGFIVMAIKARQGEATTMLTPEIEACVEADNHGSGGFHLIFFQPDGSQTRLSFVATNCAEPMGTSRDPHRTARTFDGAVYPNRAG